MIKRIAALAACYCLALVGPSAVSAQSPMPAMSGSPMKMPAKVKVRYDCSNLKMTVTYNNKKNRASMEYGAKHLLLPRVASADGTRYMNSSVEWWAKGDTATLSSVTKGQADTVLANCTVIKKK